MLRGVLGVSSVLGLLGCGPVGVEEGLARYRERIAERIGPSEEGSASEETGIRTRLPRRRARRIEVGDQRIGPFDFLGLIGCSLSEVVAARNAPLGKVLEPTRRLAHEVRVLDAARECLPSLESERAARLRTLVDAKQAELDAHRWNAVWLDAELERYLGDGPRALIGGRDPGDGPWQLRQAAAALRTRPFEPADVAALEAALSELRDDPAVGSWLRAIEAARADLSWVADRIGARTGSACDQTSKRLVREFREAYLPIQAKLADLDRRARPLLASLDELHRATDGALQPSPAMRRYAAQVLDARAESGLWQRYREALERHSKAWSDLLSACGLSVLES